MLKRFLRFAVAGLCALLLSSCASISLQTEELMRPPQLSESQSEVYNALVNALGTSSANVSLRYPRSGTYRSAFTFYDLDGDNLDEVLVFYSLTDDESALYVNILSQKSGVWESICDIPGLGESLVSVEFSSLSQSDKRDIIIGWETEGDPNRTLSVMRLANNQLHTLYEGSYIHYATADLDNAGLDELVTVALSSSGRRPFVALIQPDVTTLTASSHVQFNLDMTSISKISIGRLSPNMTGLLVDGYADGIMASELIAYEDGAFALPFARGDEFYTSTSRKVGTTTSADRNGDGTLEIPVQTPVPGQYDAGGDDLQYYTTYCQLDPDNNLVPQSTVYVNREQGYTFTLPIGWAEQTTISTQTSTNEVRFTSFDPDDESAAGVDLLKIRVYSQKDYQDKFDTNQYVEIGRKGIFRYYASLPENNSPLSITMTQLQTLFKLS